jgi:hypothetical protein
MVVMDRQEKVSKGAFSFQVVVALSLSLSLSRQSPPFIHAARSLPNSHFFSSTPLLKQKQEERKVSYISLSLQPNLAHKMSEFSFSNTFKKTEFSSLLLSDFFKICFFVLSHPLYFSYFIFFSPYLLKFLSFLSPLFITTLLLLLVLLTVSPHLVQEKPHSSELGFLVSTSQTVLNVLQPKVDDDSESFHQFEELEVYKIVFDTSSFEIREEEPVEVLEVEVKEICSSQAYDEAPVDKSLVYEGKSEGIISEQSMEVKRLECLFQEENELEKTMSFSKEEKEVNPPGVESYKVEEKEEEEEEEEDKEKASKVMEINAPNLGSFGSMRKEKEWRRTLACKLFEERHNVEGGGGGEGMDMLWETYETESNKGKGGSNRKKSDEDDDDEDEEEDMDEQLCCLQALKFSAGKMNLGMGKPNLVKISKTLKGFGWLHNLSRHGKKGYR